MQTKTLTTATLRTRVCASGLLAILLLTGCDHLSRDGNLSRYYQPYVGVQTNWPTSPASFVTDYDGFAIYHSFPPVPYTIVGRFDRPNIPLFRVVKCARYHKANTIFFVEETVTSTQTDPDVTFFNSHVAVNFPGQTRRARHNRSTAYLANTNSTSITMQ